MKKTLILFSIIFFSYSFLSAQEIKKILPYKTSFAIGTGINSNVGILGLLFEYKLNTPFSLYGGAGFGSWGYKLSVGARYYFTKPRETGVGISFSSASGAKAIDVQTDVDTNGVTVGGGPKHITFDAKRVNVLNVSWIRYWKMKKQNRFINLELGYSFLLTHPTYTFSPQGFELTDKSKSIINNIQPGGILISVSYILGL